MKRRIFAARVRFHDWMWKGADSGLRWYARRLPLYFSDPYWMPRSQIDHLFKAPISYREATFTQAPKPNRWVTHETRTWASGTSITLRLKDES